MDHIRQRATGRAVSRAGRTRAPTVPRDVLDQDILSALTKAEIPLGAYQLATTLRDRYHGVPVASVYRALDRLVAEGRVQRIATLSAYRVRDAASDLVMICVSCGRTSSIAAPAAREKISIEIARNRFAVSNIAIEALGKCDRCAGIGLDEPSQAGSA